MGQINCPGFRIIFFKDNVPVFTFGHLGIIKYIKRMAIGLVVFHAGNDGRYQVININQR